MRGSLQDRKMLPKRQIPDRNTAVVVVAVVVVVVAVVVVVELKLPIGD